MTPISSTLLSVSTPSITPNPSTGTTTSTHSVPSSSLPASTTSTTVVVLTTSTSSVASAATAASGITYNVVNSPTPNYQLPFPTAGLSQNNFAISGNANVPGYTAYHSHAESQIIYLSATSPGGITALWDVTNPSQIAMTNPGQYSIVIDNSGIYMSLWDWSAEISATAPNFFSLLNGASSPSSPLKFRTRSASRSRAHSTSLKPRDLTDFEIALTVSASCSNSGTIPPYITIAGVGGGTTNCTVTPTGLSSYLGACSYPPGPATCQAILGASFTSLSSLGAFASPVSAAMKAAQILNGIEQTPLASSAALFTPYLGAELMNFATWMGTFEAAFVGQAGGAVGAGNTICQRWGDLYADVVVSYPGGNPPPTTILELQSVPTTTVVASIGFLDPWVQPC
ncbi:hypothetical protein MMC11_002010 [Xylographa trunciseda]|nr:hypothetical protein [Xylographa trunciseda]